MYRFRTAAAVTCIVMAAVFMVGTLPAQVDAADPVESITLSPASKSYKVDAGQTFDDTITVVNDGDTAYDFTVYTAPYSVKDGTYDPNFTEVTSNSDAYTWVQFKQTTWHAEPRDTLKVPYTVHVKPNAAPGGHYGVIFAEVQPADSGSGTSTLARKKRVGTILYASVSGDIRLEGHIAGTTIPWFQSRAPLTANMTVQNTGNNDFTAKVTYRISDIFGGIKYTAKSEYVVLPSTTRDITVQWAGAPWFGLYKARITTDFLNTTSIVESYVLIMPVWMVLLFGVAIVSGGIYAIWRWSHRSKR